MMQLKALCKVILDEYLKCKSKAPLGMQIILSEDVRKPTF